MTPVHPDERTLIDHFYGELPVDAADRLRAHLAECPDCAAAFATIEADLVSLDLPCPDGGARAVRTALRVAGLPDPAARPATAVRGSSPDEILTPEEVAAWLKVPVDSVGRMLHALPHFVFDGQVRIRKEALLHFIDGLERGRARVAQPDPGTFFLRRHVI